VREVGQQLWTEIMTLSNKFVPFYRDASDRGNPKKIYNKFCPLTMKNMTTCPVDEVSSDHVPSKSCFSDNWKSNEPWIVSTDKTANTFFGQIEERFGVTVMGAARHISQPKRNDVTNKFVKLVTNNKQTSLHIIESMKRAGWTSIHPPLFPLLIRSLSSPSEMEAITIKNVKCLSAKFFDEYLPEPVFKVTLLEVFNTPQEVYYLFPHVLFSTTEQKDGEFEFSSFKVLDRCSMRFWVLTFHNRMSFVALSGLKSDIEKIRS
jgi:hypothetical protein